MGGSLDGIAAWIREADRLMDHWEAVLPLRLHTVRYEDLVGRPEEVLRGVCVFLDLEFVPEVLAPERSTRTVATTSVLQVKEALHGAIGRAWSAVRTVPPPVVPVRFPGTTFALNRDWGCRMTRSRSGVRRPTTLQFDHEGTKEHGG